MPLLRVGLYSGGGLGYEWGDDVVASLNATCAAAGECLGRTLTPHTYRHRETQGRGEGGQRGGKGGEGKRGDYRIGEMRCVDGVCL